MTFLPNRKHYGPYRLQDNQQVLQCGKKRNVAVLQFDTPNIPKTFFRRINYYSCNPNNINAGTRHKHDFCKSFATSIKSILEAVKNTISHFREFWGVLRTQKETAGCTDNPPPSKLSVSLKLLRRLLNCLQCNSHRDVIAQHVHHLANPEFAPLDGKG